MRHFDEDEKSLVEESLHLSDMIEFEYNSPILCDVTMKILGRKYYKEILTYKEFFPQHDLLLLPWIPLESNKIEVCEPFRQS